MLDAFPSSYDRSKAKIASHRCRIGEIGEIISRREFRRNDCIEIFQRNGPDSDAIGVEQKELAIRLIDGALTADELGWRRAGGSLAQELDDIRHQKVPRSMTLEGAR